MEGYMMESPVHSLNALFAQLGMDSRDEAIAAFVKTHKGKAAHVLLYEADCWSPSQAGFLKQALDEDADWAMVVDQLSALLQ
jgi:hypothetical protein